MIIEIPDENSIVKWKKNDKDEWKSAEISDLIKTYEDRPQGDLISREALKNDLITFFPDKCLEGITTKTLFAQIMHDIDNAPTVEMPNWYKVYEDVKSTFERPQCNQIAWEQGYEVGYAQGKAERPQGKWIPVSERLPKPQNPNEDIYLDNVLVCIERRNGQKVIDTAYYDFDEEEWVYHGSYETEVIAWQPLPEPYKEGGAK